MENRLRDLPEYEHPPLAEVVLSVEFEEVVGLTAPYLGALWYALFKNDFPRAEQYPPVPSTTESFGASPGNPQMQFKIVQANAAPSIRCWFLTSDGNELLQLQSDRLTHNWRKIRDGDVYPRYEYIRQKFESEYQKISHWLEAEELGRLVPTQAEVTYVNQIASGNSWMAHREADKVFSFLRPEGNDEGAALEGVDFQRRYVLSNNGSPYGRLHVSGCPILKLPEHLAGYKLDIVARGPPRDASLDGVLAFFDFGRDAIVKKFDQLTTSNLHDEWEKK